MALITRVARLFRSDLHVVLDRVEEPEVLLRQAIREMEEELSSDEQRIKLMRHEQRPDHRSPGGSGSSACRSRRATRCLLRIEKG
ncbi:MAG: PspA/IM30 family protein [Gammaproteobacteria bacterium]